MSEHPTDVLRRHRPWRADMPKALGEFDAALRAVEQLEQAARELVESPFAAHRRLHDGCLPRCQTCALVAALALFDRKEQT